MKTLALILVLASMACGSKQTSAPTLYSYGDSVTYGAFTNGVSYATDIAQMIGQNIANKAISGTEMVSPNQYPLIMSDVWPSGSIVIFTPGANDSGSAGDPVYVSQYQQDLTDILNKAASLPIKFYLGTPITPLNATGGWVAANIDVFANINRQAVAALNSPNVVLIDFNSAYIPTAQTDADTYHPNALGYQIMTQIFFNIAK